MCVRIFSDTLFCARVDGSQAVMNIESATPSRTQSPMESDPCNEGTLYVLCLVHNFLYSNTVSDSVPGEVQSSMRGSVFLQMPDEEPPSLDEQANKDIERFL